LYKAFAWTRLPSRIAATASHLLMLLPCLFQHLPASAANNKRDNYLCQKHHRSWCYSCFMLGKIPVMNHVLQRHMHAARKMRHP